MYNVRDDIINLYLAQKIKINFFLNFSNKIIIIYFVARFFF